jgi:TRAP-type uncharacterized transport system fused permease subunit
MVERKSPGFSAFWSASFMLLTWLDAEAAQGAVPRRGARSRSASAEGFWEVTEGLIAGARNMIGLACAMARGGHHRGLRDADRCRVR